MVEISMNRQHKFSKNPQPALEIFHLFHLMKNEKQNIKMLLQRSFEKGAWHGPATKEALQLITQQTSGNRLPNTHSIIELVTHMTAWRNFVIQKLSNNADYQVSDEMNFPSTQNWASAMADLEKSQLVLLEAIEKFPEAKLTDLVPGVSNHYTFYTLLHGIIHHDTYHTGQISLIYKATGTNVVVS
jgi:uncharacterized damage-inducible protein DinB